MDLGIFLGVLGILLTIILFVLSLKYKKPSFYIKSATFDYKPLKNKVKTLEIFYEKKPIEQLTISRILFINKGTEGISKNDIVQNDPIKIKLSSQYKIYESLILYNDDQRKSNFDIISDFQNNIVKITFDYLETYQGAIIQIIHNGYEGNIKITGGIRNVKNITKLTEKSGEPWFYGYFTITAFIILVLFQKMHYFLLKVFDINPIIDSLIYVVFLCILSLISGWCLVKIESIPFFASLFPKIIPSKYRPILNKTWIIK